MKALLSCFVTLAFSGLAMAQAAPPVGPPGTVGPTSSLQAQLQQLDSNARKTQEDLERVRVEKWKTDGQTKGQMRDNIAALEKNLGSAVPDLIQKVQANPTSVGAAIKLYRNINVVYDVLASVAESAGAFGPKDDYQALANDLNSLDNIRRDVGNRVEQLASAQDAAYTQLLNQVRAERAAAAAAAAPPKKTIVDDTEPPKKTAKAKKKKKAPSTPATSTASPPQ